MAGCGARTPCWVSLTEEGGNVPSVPSKKSVSALSGCWAAHLSQGCSLVDSSGQEDVSVILSPDPG